MYEIYVCNAPSHYFAELVEKITSRMLELDPRVGYNDYATFLLIS